TGEIPGDRKPGVLDWIIGKRGPNSSRRPGHDGGDPRRVAVWPRASKTKRHMPTQAAAHGPDSMLGQIHGWIACIERINERNDEILDEIHDGHVVFDRRKLQPGNTSSGVPVEGEWLDQVVIEVIGISAGWKIH